MKITHIGHACVLVEVDGINLISDPWWRGPCFGAQWWIYPAPYLKALEDKQIDYIYISHGHHDHFHPGTLKTLPRSAKVLVSRELHDLAPAIRELGYQVVEVGSAEEVHLSSKASARILPTHGGDTLLALTDGQETCINLNDALHSAPTAIQDRYIRLLKELYRRIDYVFCGYGVASHFPNCYVIPGKNNALTAAHRQQYFNRQWAKIISGLAPRFGFPFAADVVFLEDSLFWVNEPTHNSERPTDVFRTLYPESRTQVLDIAPGFSIADGKVVREALNVPIAPEVVRQQCADGIGRANRRVNVSRDEVKHLVALLQQNIEVCKPFLLEYDDDWTFVIQLQSTPYAIDIRKRRATIEVKFSEGGADSYDVRYTVRPAYLRLSLTERYGHELLFVGSGGIFEFRSKEIARNNVHRELMVILRKHDHPPMSRYGNQSKFLFHAKRAVKKLLSKTEPDLYDLSQWSVFEAS